MNLDAIAAVRNAGMADVKSQQGTLEAQRLRLSDPLPPS